MANFCHAFFSFLGNFWPYGDSVKTEKAPWRRVVGAKLAPGWMPPTNGVLPELFQFHTMSAVVRAVFSAVFLVSIRRAALSAGRVVCQKPLFYAPTVAVIPLQRGFTCVTIQNVPNNNKTG